MDYKFLITPAFSITLLLGTAGVLRAQELAGSPEPPDPPGPAMAAPDMERMMLFTAQRGRLGVALRDVNAEKARELKLPSEYGAIVERVEADSPAAKAGVQKGDVILEYAGQRVWSVAQLSRLIRETPLERTVALQVLRNGQTRTLSTKLEAPKETFDVRLPEAHIPPMPMPDFNFRFMTPGARLGISADDLTSQLAGYFGVKQGKGVLVREVIAGSAAEKAGLKAGDVITKVDHTDIGSVNDLRHALPRDFEGKRKVALTIVRDRREQTLSVELEAPGPRVRSLEREVTRLRDQEVKHLGAQIAERKADLQSAAAEATREWTEQRRRYMQEMRKSLELLQRELQKQKLQELREKLSWADVV